LAEVWDLTRNARGGPVWTVVGMEETDATDKLIVSYYPTRTKLTDQALTLVRASVRKAGPLSGEEASRLLTHTARHVAMAVARGVVLETRLVFAPAEIAASVREVRDNGAQWSPFQANLDRVARAAAPRLGHTTPTRIPGSPRLRPYESQERALLAASARGMTSEGGRSLLGGLALGMGVGLIGPAAGAVMAEHVVRFDGGVAVWVPDQRRHLGCEPAWATVLAELAEAPGTRLTGMYDSVARQRLARELGRSTGRPELKSERLRNTWLVELLRRDLPIPVIAAAAGIGASTLVRYLEFVPAPSGQEMIDWLASTGAAKTLATPGIPILSAPAVGAAPSLRAGRGVAEVLRAYVPRDSRVATIWQGELGSQFNDAVSAATHDPARARNLVMAAAALVAWALDTGGIPLTRSALLKDSTIDRWVATSMASSKSTAAIRPRLRALAEAAGVRKASRHAADPVAHPVPYSDQELECLLACRPALGAADQTVLDAHLVACLGAGASGRDLGRLRSGDIVRVADVPHIRFPDGRLVPVRPDAQDLARQMALSGGLMTGRETRKVTRFRQRISNAAGVGLDPGRLRATWLLRQVGRGVPLRILVAAAGTQLLELTSLVALLPAVPDEEVVAWTSSGARSLPPD